MSASRQRSATRDGHDSRTVRSGSRSPIGSRASIQRPAASSPPLRAGHERLPEPRVRGRLDLGRRHGDADGDPDRSAGNRVIASLRLADAPLVVDGLAFVDGKLWIVRPAPMDESRGDVVAIDPATNKVVRQATMPRTFSAMSAGTDALWYARQHRPGALRHAHAARDRRPPRRDRRARRLGIASWIARGARPCSKPTPARARRSAPIPMHDTVNVVAAIGTDVVWIAAQPNSASPEP